MGRGIPHGPVLSLLEQEVVHLHPALLQGCMPYPCTSPGLAPALGCLGSAWCHRSDGEAESIKAHCGLSRAGEQAVGKGGTF